MKYNIHINQLALKDSGLDLQSCAVLDYLKCLCSSTNNKVEEKKLDDYFWVSLSNLKDQMPLLGITTVSGISVKIQKLKKLGWIETKTVRQKKSGVKSYLYLRMTPKVRLLDFTSKEEMDKLQLTIPTTTVNDSRELQLNNSNTIDTNTNIIANANTTEFNSKDELDKWKQSPQQWLRLIGIYGKHKRVYERLTTKAQLNKLIPEFRKVAMDLTDFTGEQLRDAFEKCEKMKGRDGEPIDWTLRTVRKVLVK